MSLKKYICGLLLCCTLFVQAQESLAGSFYHKLKTFDLTSVINPDTLDGGYARPEFLGYIGDNYQRFQIHFTSFQKSDKNPYEYVVAGKTRVKNNICDFTGIIRVISAKYYEIVDGVNPDFPEYKFGNIMSKVEFFENKSQSGSGVIKGKLSTDVYFDEKGNLFYDDLMAIADGYYNNQFTGSWTSYITGNSKKCNWGDFRIPDSGSLDYGAGAFTLNKKYIHNGWESYYYSYCCSPDTNRTKEARKKELEKWWE